MNCLKIDQPEIYQFGENDHLKRLVLEAFTGIDQSVANELSLDLLESHLMKLSKEIQSVVEILEPGASDLVTGTFGQVHDNNTNLSTVLNDLSALMEYGKLFCQLGTDKASAVEEHQLQEEIQHFWRIMGVDDIRLDYLGKGNIPKFKKIVGDVDEVMDVVGNFARLLGVVNERRSIKDQPPYLLPVDKHSAVGARLEVSSQQAIMKRNSYPYTFGMISIGSGNGDIRNGNYSNMLKKVGNLYDRLIVKFPLEVVTMLLDNYIANKPEEFVPINLAAIQEYVGGDERKIKGIVSGDHTILVLSPKSKGNGIKSFEKDVTEKLVFNEGELGNIYSTSYQVFDLTVDQGDLVFLFQGEHAVAVCGENEENLEEIVNAKGKKKKILPRSNFTKYFKRKKAGGLNRVFASYNVGKAKEFKLAEWSDDEVSQKVAPITSYVQSLGAEQVHVSLEAGHLHADRLLAKIQEDGMWVGGILGNILSKLTNVSVVYQPMIDDDHVVNRLDYFEYLNTAAKNGMPVDELIFESSPMIRALAVDILKKLVANSDGIYSVNKGEIDTEDASAGKVVQEGDNLYLTIGEGKRIELIEGISNEFTSGCVLFDAALTLYRNYSDAVSDVYNSQIKLNHPNSKLCDMLQVKNVHEVMLDNYKAEKNPSLRDNILHGLFGAMVPDYGGLVKSLEDIPYLDAVQVSSKKDEEKGIARVTINVLEGFYQAQQDKLKALFLVLGIQPNHLTVTLDHSSYKIQVVS